MPNSAITLPVMVKHITIGSKSSVIVTIGILLSRYSNVKYCGLFSTTTTGWLATKAWNHSGDGVDGAGLLPLLVLFFFSHRLKV